MPLFIKETTRLLAERSRQRHPDLERMQRRLADVEQELAHIMTAIKQGCLTVTTKAELEKAEAERVRLDETIKTNAATVDKVVTLLPRAAERYAALVQDLGPLSLTHTALAREQIRTLVGTIKLMPTADGYLKAELVGSHAGLLKLAVGGKLDNVVAGEGFEPSTFGL